MRHDAHADRRLALGQRGGHRIFDVEEFARCIMPQPLRRDPLPVDQYVEGARPLIAPIGRLKDQRPRLHLHAEFEEAARPGVASLAAAIGHGVADVAGQIMIAFGLHLAQEHDVDRASGEILQPRLFRIPEREAIINRMGFNNKGVDHLVDQVRKRRYQGILGINIGKNATTPVENAADDYLIGMRKVYAHADYITVNVSSPNTPGLRDLQFGDSLNRLLETLKKEQLTLQEAHQRYVPVAVKIAPDMDDIAIAQVATALAEQGMDGVIATNTTIGREGVEGCVNSEEAGGLSGLPVRDKSTRVIAGLHSHLGGKLPIIGVGGIFDGPSAVEKIKAGASLVQIYSGFIYRGPAVVTEAASAIAQMEK